MKTSAIENEDPEAIGFPNPGIGEFSMGTGKRRAGASAEVSSDECTSGLRRDISRIVLGAVIAVALVATNGLDAQSYVDDDDVEVLTRGPVHEAFAPVVDYNPERGFVAPIPPPSPIDEIPPDERLAGDDVSWIPGYWAWDDEERDYIWVSGIWRSPPPGREWVTGYWAESRGEYIWISGYWGEIAVRETTYLPPPPESLERGPSSPRPSIDYWWTPGCWVWQEARYAWRPGYWARPRVDWIWVPSHYVWTPHGYVYIDGYWDYVPARRGIIYAPVRFRNRVYSRRGYSYSPRVCFNIGVFVDHLFLRPRWNHYYFGDYYAPRYADAGFYFTFSYQSSWIGYDPFYSYRCWENRRVSDWERRYRDSYHYRREHEVARPPRTWSAQLTVIRSSTTTTNQIVVAGTAEQLSRTKDFPSRFQKVDRAERERFEGRSRNVREARDTRRRIEVASPQPPGRDSVVIEEPRRLERASTGIAAKAGRNLAPRRQAEPKPDLTAKPVERGRGGPPERGNEQATRGNRPDSRPGLERRAAEEQQRPRPEERTTNQPQRATQQENGRGPDRANERASNAEIRRQEQAAERAQRDASARAKQEAEARTRRDADARAKQEASAQAKRNAEARAQREADARDRARAQEEAKRAAAAEREKAAAERRAAQERERAQAVARSEARAKQEADARAKRDAEARAKREAETRKAQQLEAQRAAEQKAAQARAERDRRENDRRAAAQEQERARRESDARAKQEAEARARQEAEARARAEKAEAARNNAKRNDDKKEEKSEEDSPGKGKGKGGGPG